MNPQIDSGEGFRLASQIPLQCASLAEGENRQLHQATEFQVFRGHGPTNEARPEVKKESTEAKDSTRFVIMNQRDEQGEKREKSYKTNKLIRDLIQTIEGVLLNTSKSVEEGRHC